MTPTENTMHTNMPAPETVIPPPLDVEIEGAITDAAASSLPAPTAAAGGLRKVGGATTLQVFTAAIHVIREYRKTVDDLTSKIDDLTREIARLEYDL